MNVGLVSNVCSHYTRYLGYKDVEDTTPCLQIAIKVLPGMMSSYSKLGNFTGNIFLTKKILNLKIAHARAHTHIYCVYASYIVMHSVCMNVIHMCVCIYLKGWGRERKIQGITFFSCSFTKFQNPDRINL